MKKILLTLAAIGAMATATEAQEVAYTMNILLTDGTTVRLDADKVQEITFEAQSVDPEPQGCYEYFQGTFAMTFMDYDGVLVRDVELSLPAAGSEDYGSKIYVHAPAFLQGANSYDLDFVMDYAYDEATERGTLAIVVDDHKIGRLNDTYNLFFRLDNLPVSDDYIAGQYVINFSAADIEGGKAMKRADASQTLYIVACAGETFTEVAGQLNIVTEVRLKKSAL